MIVYIDSILLKALYLNANLNSVSHTKYMELWFAEFLFILLHLK